MRFRSVNLKIHVLLSLAGLIFGTLAAVALVFWLNSEEAALGGLWTESLIFFAVFVVLAFFFFSRPALYLKALSPQISSFDDGTEYAKSSGETNEGIALVLLALALPLGEGAAFGMGGLLLIIMTYRRFWRELPPQPLLGAVGLGFLCWIGFGFLATVLSPACWVRPRELSRLYPFVLFALQACSE